MFGRDTHTPKPKKPLEPRPLRTISINEVLTPTPEFATQEPYHESYFWWINPENTVTLEAIAALYQYQYGTAFTYHTRRRNQTPFCTLSTQTTTSTQVSALKYQTCGVETKDKVPVKRAIRDDF